MYYRRKILLALLEAAGGNLSSTDMEKLLFLFCMEQEKNHYDFFPYKFGCFSFMSYQDKRILTDQGYLSDVENFKLYRRKSTFHLLKSEDRYAIKDFARQTNKLRGDKLIRYVYLKYPYYATRSEITDRVLSDEEKNRIGMQRKTELSKCLMTIGYEGLTIDSYIDKLMQNNVSIVIDVRRNPISMKYGFSKTRLRNYLNKVGIAYEHIPELGIDSSLRKNLETVDDYNELFADYAMNMLHNSEDHLSRITRILASYNHVALTCFEAKATSCHRHKITEHLHKQKHWNTPIVHIV